MRDSASPELAARIVDAADDFRRRLERELHDGAQQRLASVVLALGLAGRTLTGDAAGLVAEARSELSLAMAELRDLARDIYPVLLTEAGLGPALASLTDRCPVPVVVSAVPAGRLADSVERTCYFVVSETLGNMAGATRAEVAVREPGGHVTVEVLAVGAGRGPDLSALADRVQAHGGRLHVESDRVMADLPCA
ncbi:signal transduction histidine kinase [Kibdelosporangium banguiense]|uniref:histidine kinase n=1 Tax=Kibdelosporangium banguiense TaxID=1365924 RepID=A0ABS4TLT4_9PSEU|nr:histidine kinase [Kibdelosporangium banguiense]MBP2324969.1 signal transduction histidine kinase [Kibdelosporangium banguiense]